MVLVFQWAGGILISAERMGQMGAGIWGLPSTGSPHPTWRSKMRIHASLPETVLWYQRHPEGGVSLCPMLQEACWVRGRATWTKCDCQLVCCFCGSWFRHMPGNLILLQGPYYLEQIKILPCYKFHMGRMKINPAHWAFMEGFTRKGL